jgi:hypothetical protein
MSYCRDGSIPSRTLSFVTHIHSSEHLGDKYFVQGLLTHKVIDTHSCLESV